MGSTSDLPVMKKAADFLNSMEVPFEMLALSAHRTPEEVADFARNAAGRGVKVIIAGAGGAAPPATVCLFRLPSRVPMPSIPSYRCPRPSPWQPSALTAP